MADSTSPGRYRARRTWLVRGSLIALGIVVGALLFGRGGSGPATDESAPVGAVAEKATVWTCSMHPQIRMPGPGKCPICFMDLIPVTEDDGTDSPIQLSMSETAMQLAEVQTVRVRRDFVETETRTVGKVQADERNLRKISAWVGGRLDRLYVDYTGIPVRTGDHLAEIYSPELYSAQAELIEAGRTNKELETSRAGLIRETAEATVIAAREKLRLFGLTDNQIADIETRGTPMDHLTLYSPVEGIVVHKAAVEGDYVKTGSPIYTIAELSAVWVMLDVYESDLPWVHYGQNVEFEVEAFPGEFFAGRIAFLDPLVNPSTRTVKVRLNVPNPDHRLKPDMFVRAVIRSKVLSDGRMLAPDLAGKWISPMHPEIVKNHPGTCDICGMPLVPAEKLGFVTRAATVAAPLVIPATAPLITGKRAVVYIRVPGTERPTFEGREVVLGPRAGNSYVVKSGLAEGDEIVVKGNFKIDSAMQIQAKPSMMSPEGGAPAPGHQHGGSDVRPGSSPSEVPRTGSSHEGHSAVPEARTPGLPAAIASLGPKLAPIYAAYFGLHAALAADDAAGATGAIREFAVAVREVDPSMLAGEERSAWISWRDFAAGAAETPAVSENLADLRGKLPPLTDAIVELEKAAGPPDGEAHRLVFCPMAFDNAGAFWVQKEEGVMNPYFGKSMPKCGEVRDTFVADGQ